MSVTFSIIILSGQDQAGEHIHDEIQIGGIVDSGAIAGLPDFQKATLKYRPGVPIMVDNYAYELCGRNLRSRKASREEIAQIVDDDFPYNYGTGCVNPIDHPGPDQFMIRDNILYVRGHDGALPKPDTTPQCGQLLNKQQMGGLNLE